MNPKDKEPVASIDLEGVTAQFFFEVLLLLFLLFIPHYFQNPKMSNIFHIYAKNLSLSFTCETESEAKVSLKQTNKTKQ